MGEEPTPEQRTRAREIAREWMLVTLWQEHIRTLAARDTALDIDDASKAAVVACEEDVTHTFQMAIDDRLLGNVPEVTALLVELELARLWKLVGSPWSDEDPRSGTPSG